MARTSAEPAHQGASSTLHYPSLASSFDGKGLSDGNYTRGTASLHEGFILVNHIHPLAKEKKIFQNQLDEIPLHKACPHEVL